MSPPPSDSQSESASTAPKARTLPPPEWTEREGPRSAASLALELHQADPPISRRLGPRAERNFYQARVAAAAAAGDAEGERAAAASLARTLATRGAELDVATKLARRALVLGDDPVLREELAGWFAMLGEPALAAATLRPLLGEQRGARAAQTLTRIAVYLGRAGDAIAAADALAQATREDDEDPVPPELLGGIGAWAPYAVTAERAAAAYVEGHRRRDARGERAAAFEDLLRAFEMAPSERVPAELLADALASRGRVGAADEVRREHAKAVGEAGRAVHLARLRAFIEAGDLPRALGAAFDARLDQELDPEEVLDADYESGAAPASLEALLHAVGLHELLAARLELACESLSGSQRSVLRGRLARLYGGTLSSPARAAEAWIDSLLADPDNEDAKAALRSHATTARDSSPLVEALIRVGKSAPRSGRLACLRELALLADQRLDDPGLSLWALEHAESIEPHPDLAALVERLEARKRRQDEELLRARAELAETSGAERLERLRRVASIVRGRPDDPDACIAALVEVSEADPDERTWQLTLERVLEREQRTADLEAVLRRALSRSTAASERERLRAKLSSLRRAAQDVDGALQELVPLSIDGAAHPAAFSMALLLAAGLGDENARADALSRLAQPLSPTLRAVLTSIAAESWLLAGELERGRAAAEQASHVDPSLARPVAVLAQIALLSGPTQQAAVALERAMGVVMPRASLAEALAEAYEALAQPELSLVWTQRWLALRPGEPRAAKTLLGRVTESGDATRLGDALSWLLAQPQPLRPMAREIGAALLRLAELDRERGAAMARRALDVLGPRATELKDVLLAISDISGQPGLGIAVVERALAAGTQGVDRAEVLLEVATRRKAAGDADGAAAAIARAIVEGAPPARVLEELSSALPARSSDGEIALLEARAEAMSGMAAADPSAAAHAWRELGAARWDLAGDAAGAARAWERAAALDPERGVQRLARDIAAFGGYAEALGRLEEIAAKKRDPVEAAQVLAVAATVALGAGESREALRVAARALELDPAHTDVLAIAERAASSEDIALLQRIYEGLSRAALGCYGERAVHYRAARVLERRDELKAALQHATRAFEAVPAEGVALVLMTRLAERAGDAADVVQAIERVASRASDPAERAGWLQRAAAISADGEEGRRQRVEVLLRALAVRPDADTLDRLAEALRELVALVPDYREIAELRVERAFASLLSRLSGPDGARTALAAAALAADVIGSERLALSALERALMADADVDEFSRLLSRAESLARERERASALVERVAGMVDDKFANLGRPALELTARMARALGDARARSRLLLAAAKKDPDDSALVREAADAKRATLDSSTERVDDPSGLSELGERAERSGDLNRAIEIQRRLSLDPGSDRDERKRALVKLRDLYARTGKRDELEALLERQLASGELDVRERILVGRDLAAMLGARGDVTRALAVLDPLIGEQPDEIDLLADSVTLARQAGDRRRLADALGRLADSSSGMDKLVLLQELAPILEEVGDQEHAFARWAEVLAIEPNDVAALAALERDAEARGDFDTVVALLGRRAALVNGLDDVRRIRLRRATVLEQRLGRADEARAELEGLLSATGDSLSVLRVLADLDQRLGDPLRAAPLWLRASAITTDKSEAADLARRACEAYLSGGDAAAARRVLDGMEAWAHSQRLVELRIEIERAEGDPRALAAALEELASLEQIEPVRCASLLVEAARALYTAGDIPAAAERARRAALLTPNAADAQLTARWLEYLMRAAGTPEAARLTVVELRQIQEPLTPEQAELRAFLVAEALDVALGSGAGMRELSRAAADLGRLPLIALATAERLVDGGEPERSLPLFEAALAGDLRDLRTRARVALAAANAAHTAGELERALAFVEVAGTDPNTRAEALALAAKLSDALAERRGAAGAALPEPPRPRLSVTPPTRRSSEEESARLTPGPERRPTPAAESVPVTTRSEPPDKPRTLPPIPREEPGGGAPVLVERASAPAGVRVPSRPPPPDSGPEIRVAVQAETDAERTLLDALAHGSVEAGHELIKKLERRADRTLDLVSVCRKVVTLLPGDREALERLHQAAIADRNQVYASAVEHVLKAFEPGAEPVVPPPLSDQPENPDAVRRMLLRDTATAAGEALALVWEGAGHVFRRDPGTYGVTGLERVPFGAPTPLARVYSAAVRMLGVRTPFFQRRSSGPVTLSIALLSPPAVIVSGEVPRESLQLRFHVGAMLAAAMPEHALLFGSVESQVRGILKALALAFGTPEDSKSGLTSIASLAETLWESIPTRSQRRLRELCDDPVAVDYDLAMASARRASRRAGLLSCGDVRTALRETCTEEGIALATLDEPGGLAALCSASPAVADVVRLATSHEYAEARWQPAKSGNRPGSGTWAGY